MESQTNNGDRHNGNWTLGGLLIVLGILFLLNEFFNFDLGALVPITILGGIGFTFFAVYLNNREHWWALIPAYVMWAIAGIIVLASLLNMGELVAPYVMFAIAFPFLYVYVRNRENWWALIPAGIMGTIGIGLMVGAVAQFVFPAIPALMVIAGIYLLIRSLGSRPRGEAETTERRPVERKNIEFEPITPRTGPEADKPRS